MIFSNLIRLIRGNFSLRRSSTLSPLLSVAVAAGVSFLLLSLVIGVRRVAVGGVLAKLPITRLVVGPKQLDFLFLRLGSPTTSFEAGIIDSIRALDGVSAVWPEMVMTMPTSLVGNLIGTAFGTDCATYGVHPDFFPEEERSAAFDTPLSAGEPTPAILSSQLIDLYNSGFAEAQNLPSLSSKALVGRHFTLFLGTSSFFPAPPAGKTKQIRCRIVGLSDLVSVTGVTVPIETARKWHAWFYDGIEQEKFSSLHVILSSSEVVSDVRKEIEELGLHAKTSGEMADKIALVARYLSIVTGVLMLLLLLLAGLGTANTLGLEVSFQAQRIGLYRAVGASRRDILGIYLLRAVGLGVLGSISGLCVSLIVLLAAERILIHIAPFIARLPTSPLAVSPFAVIVSGTLAVAACVLAGIGPALRAANIDPVIALRRHEM